MPKAAACACARGAPLAGLRLGRRSAGAAGRGATRIAAASGRVALATRGLSLRCPATTVADLAAALPAARATRLHRAALRRRAQHAGRARRAARSSCACCATPCSEAAGAADLLLPRVGLGSVFPAPALAWLERNGATIRLAPSGRADRSATGPAGASTAAPLDRVVLAASAVEAARLVAPHAPAWAATAGALRYEPIATVYARSAGCTPAASRCWRSHAGDADRPAQFVFDRGQLGGARRACWRS